MKTSLYTRATLHPVVAGVVAATSLAATIALIAGNKSKLKDAGVQVHESGPINASLSPATDE